MAGRETHFPTIGIQGAILPADLLQRVMAGDKQLGGLRPEAYHLSEGERINEAITRSWNRLYTIWKHFSEASVRLPDSDLGTSLARERWLLPLFQELGYGRLQTARAVEVKGKSFAISHGWGHTPIHLVSFRVDLDIKQARVAGAARSSPHSLVQELLNTSEAHLWGLVSNGLKLRILRDNASLVRQAYVEFDLQAVFDGEVYADFALLWLLCHQSRVESDKPEDCWLEKWSKAAHEQGSRALEDLRQGVEKAISALGSGFLKHSANQILHDRLRLGQLTTQDYYRQLLRLIYRLLLLFVAEDRGLLLQPDVTDDAKNRYRRFYSTERLRRLAGDLRGTRHTDLYHGLKLIMNKLGKDTGCPELGLPALGGFLFSKEALPDLDPCELANWDLLEAVRALAFLRSAQTLTRVDYMNLHSEELGSVYEALLELHPKIHMETGLFELGTATGHERKRTGSYYTPESLVQCLLDSALDPVVEDACHQPNPEHAILRLKVCDPACGSGHFLIAASHRMAKRLASIRTGDEEPSPSAMQHALRDVVGHCVYGVDQNPMAVELCKVALWMEALEPGKPLSFLDHHIRGGNSLLGTTPKLIAAGLPDDAFNPIEGDDKTYCFALKKQNKKEREGQRDMVHLMAKEPEAEYNSIEARTRGIDEAPDSTFDDIQRKAEQFRSLAESLEYQHTQQIADAWCSAFVWRKHPEAPFEPITTDTIRCLEKDLKALMPAQQAEVTQLSRRYQFFHWYLAFPEVFAKGGFDCVLGNPPWERVKLQEKEWFAERSPAVAGAPNAAARKRLIESLKTEDPALYQQFLNDSRLAEGESHLMRNSGRYPLCGRGDINTYAIFAEMMRGLLAPIGRVGSVLPTGIATDDTTKYFFGDLIQSQTLHSLYDFQSGPGLFAEIGHARFKFSLVTMSGHAARAQKGAEFAFFLRDITELHEPNRRFRLTSHDIALLNPNTQTCPIFRSGRDAELTKGIYRRAPVFIREARDDQTEENRWGIKFSTMFHMANDSHLFRTRKQLEAEGWQLRGNVFGQDGHRYLPLYGAKMLYHFTHRYGDYRDQPMGSENTSLPDVPLYRLDDPQYMVFPRYWVREEEVFLRTANVPPSIIKAYQSQNETLALETLVMWLTGYHLNKGNEQVAANLMLKFHGSPFQSAVQDFKDWALAKSMEKEFPLTQADVDLIQQNDTALGMAWALIKAKCPSWLLGWRDITNSTNERTVVASILPLAGVGHKFPFIRLPHLAAPPSMSLLANLCSFVLDFITRQKLGGTSLTYFVLKQLPVCLPNTLRDISLWQMEQGTLENWIAQRTIELVYSSWELSSLAHSLGYDGPPFRWDDGRHFLLRCEVDAAFFHVYGIARDDVDYIMETFPIVKRNDEEKYGDYRTKCVILEIYDAMTEAIRTGQLYRTRLDPLPGPPTGELPDWPAGAPQPQDWPPHIHPPRHVTKTR